MIFSLPRNGTLLAGDKMAYRLGGMIAEGGEGKVYDIQGRDDVVAKIYKESDFTRAEKLRLMIDGSTKGLRKISAWPLSTLTEADGTTVGFVMESLVGWQPLHNAYQIRSRLKLFPTRSYQFLIRSARNLATCVHHVHEAGLVIGDLNESNVLVDGNAMVKVIDVDSFQVPGPDGIFPCKVGKLELLPPELQGHSLEGVVRTPEHDRFSLAVLIFQTLVYGRHPFAGTPTVTEDISLEQCIERCYYAYTRRRDIPLKPPQQLSLNFLPPQIQQLFERAFGPSLPPEDTKRTTSVVPSDAGQLGLDLGIRPQQPSLDLSEAEPTGRPTAKEWYFALKEFENTLRTCRENPSHTFWDRLDTCPWCALEDRWNVALFRPALLGPDEHFEVDGLLREVEAVEGPPNVGTDLINFDYRSMEPAKLGGLRKLLILGAKDSGIYIWGTVLFFNLARNGAAFAIISILILFMAVAVAVVPSLWYGFRTASASKRLAKLRSRWIEEANSIHFEHVQARYRQLAHSLKDVKAAYDEQREAFIRQMHREELNTYLAKYSVLIANVGAISSEKLSYLHDNGIRTAADLSEENLKKLPRIVPQQERVDLLEWRDKLEKQFWKSRQYRLTVHQERQLIVQVRRENERRKAELERGPEELRELSERLGRTQGELAQQAAMHVEVLRRNAPLALAYDSRRRTSGPPPLL